jgi:hypothetical protein
MKRCYAFPNVKIRPAEMIAAEEFAVHARGTSDAMGTSVYLLKSIFQPQS